MEKELKPFWNKFFNFDWRFGLFLILVFCIPRFVLVLNANETTNYKYIGLIMTIYAITPFIFLTKYGRNGIGMTKSKNFSWLFYAIIIGLVYSLLLYFLGDLIYKNTFENWYVYIGKSYNIPNGINPNDKLILFAIMATTGMIFSPIGEELLFRGVIHSSFAKSIGNLKASIVDSSAFALTHISHFGLVFLYDQWDFFAFPTLIWVSSMFLVSMLFYLCRKRSKSILGAIICHSAFNFGMTYCIFYMMN